MRLAVSEASYLNSDPIAAYATALGGPIAIIRLSLPRAYDVLETLTGHRPETLVPRTVVRTRLAGLDDALFVWFQGPNSFTGEDVIELHIHGGTYSAERVFEWVLSLGFRQALPGEFSFRAVRSGKMTVSQAEAISDLITATNTSAADLALDKMAGKQNVLLDGIVEEVRQVTALSELSIDFSDQDIEELGLDRLKRRIREVENRLSKLEQSFDRGLRIQEGIKVTFVGLPNAGKSSLFNALVGTERAIVSEIPGTTRDVVFDQVVLNTEKQRLTVRVFDTAGLRRGDDQTSDQIELMGIERTVESVRSSDLVIWVVSIEGFLRESESRAYQQSLEELWKRIQEPKQKAIVVLSKVDLISDETKRASVMNGVREWFLKRGLDLVSVSTWGETLGVEELVKSLSNRANHLLHREPGEILITRLDQQQALAEALVALRRADEAEDESLFAADLHQALRSLSRMVGRTLPDDILGRIFSQFCIGK